MKKLIAILLAVCLVFALATVAFAADEKETAAADALYALGLFQGVGKDGEGKPIYDLDRAPNRMEAVTMLVRLLGKEEEANAGTWETPFTDVMDWAKPYVGYAYANGLTNGTGKTTFSGKDPVTATQYLTFVLRALGYSSETDFKWDAAWELTDKLGITPGEYGASTASFDRGDVAKISWSALAAYMKGEGRFLGEKLLDEGVFTLEQYHAAMSGESPEEEGQNPVMNWVGDYQCDRAAAHVDCEGSDSARITITWGSSAWEHTEWVIVGRLDLDTLTIAYTGATRTNYTMDENGKVTKEETVYTDGTGTIVFDQGSSFTWHEDQSDYGQDMVFRWVPVEPEEEEEGQNPVMNWIGKYAAGRPWAEVECYGKDSARITIHWSGSAWEHAEWEIIGKLDLDTLTIRYTGAVKKTITYTDEETYTETVNYEDGTGTIVFDEGLSFTWHEDQSEDGGDLVFMWAQTVPGEDAEPEEDDELWEDEDLEEDDELWEDEDLEEDDELWEDEELEDEDEPDDDDELEEDEEPWDALVGDYAAGGYEAEVMDLGDNFLHILIYRDISELQYIEWSIMGGLDPGTMTVTYTFASKVIYTYEDDDDYTADVEEVYADGTGAIVFNGDGTFTWHENQGDGKDLTFEWEQDE